MKQQLNSNLESFPSWEYDIASSLATGITMQVGSFDSSVHSARSECVGKNSSMPSASSSLSALTGTTGGSTRASSSDTSQTITSHQKQLPNYSSNSVEIFVSGSTFHVPTSIFTQLRALPLQQPGNELSTCPKLFEIILNHMMFDSFPNVATLSVSDVEELEPLALLLELHALVQHLSVHEHEAKIMVGARPPSSESSSSNRMGIFRRGSRRRSRLATAPTSDPYFPEENIRQPTLRNHKQQQFVPQKQQQQQQHGYDGSCPNIKAIYSCENTKNDVNKDYRSYQQSLPMMPPMRHTLS